MDVVVEMSKLEVLEPELEAGTEIVLTPMLDGGALMRLLLCPKDTATLVALVLVLSVLLGTALPLDAEIVDPKAT